MHFEYVFVKLGALKKILDKTNYNGILYISPIISYSPKAIEYYSYQHPGQNIIQHIQYSIEKEIRNQKLKAYNIDNRDDILNQLRLKLI